MSTSNPLDPIRDATEILKAGGVIVHATEGVWGFACDPNNIAALQRILKIKEREANKGFILIAGTAIEFALHLSAVAHADEVRASWPGAHTWVLPNREKYSDLVTGGRGTVACRVPGHQQSRALCETFGGVLVSTSANLSGQAAITSYEDAVDQFGDVVDQVLPGAVGDLGRASTIHGINGEILR